MDYNKCGTIVCFSILFPICYLKYYFHLLSFIFLAVSFTWNIGRFIPNNSFWFIQNVRCLFFWIDYMGNCYALRTSPFVLLYIFLCRKRNRSITNSYFSPAFSITILGLRWTRSIHRRNAILGLWKEASTKNTWFLASW